MNGEKKMMKSIAQRPRRKITFALLLLLLTIPAQVLAQSFQIDSIYSTQLSSKNVGGGLAYLPDGDILALTSDFSNGPKLYIYDTNNDGLPSGGKQLLASYTASLFANFVRVAPSGKFAIFGIGGSSEYLAKIDLKTHNVQKLLDVPGNFDLAFIDDTHAYVSSNPEGFNPTGANLISYFDISGAPILQPIAEISAVPSGPIALNDRGDLYYIKGTFTYPAPPASSRLLRFSAAQLSNAISHGDSLEANDSDINVTVNGGYNLAYHRLQSGSGEFFFSTVESTNVSKNIYRIKESNLTPEIFLSVVDPTAPSFTSISFLNPTESFDGSKLTHAELAVSLSTNFFSTYSLLQVHPVTFSTSNTDDSGLCISSEDDCIHQALHSSACVGANGFLSQINIASVINLQASPLNVKVDYRDLAGSLKGTVSTSVSANAKQDFIINDLGLTPDTVGTVCVTTNGASGSWTGGIALYKPDVRNGVPAFGDAFDFALYYPFLNPFEAPVTVPLNTYHLGTSPTATVANWIAISDADQDGAPLTGTLLYFNDKGENTSSENVFVPDGGRRDYAGHVGVGGTQNQDAIGMAQFVPNPKPNKSNAEFYLTVTRYFYDCVGSSCNNFLTAFNLPYRPGTKAVMQGGSSTASGEISIIELNNVAPASASAQVQVYAGNGENRGTPQVDVPSRGTRHLILNQVGQTGFLLDNSAATATVKASSGYVSAVSLFYKLNQFGGLEYAYAAPFASSPGLAQVSQFNSFISQKNIPEVFNAGDKDMDILVDFYSYTGKLLSHSNFTLVPNGTKRLSDLNIAPSDYGTIIMQGSREGLIGRNYVRREGQYVLPFSAN